MSFRLNSDFYKGKKVFVTGHTGFKGSWMCEVLLLMGAKPEATHGSRSFFVVRFE